MNNLFFDNIFNKEHDTLRRATMDMWKSVFIDTPKVDTSAPMLPQQGQYVDPLMVDPGMMGQSMPQPLPMPPVPTQAYDNQGLMEEQPTPQEDMFNLNILG